MKNLNDAAKSEIFSAVATIAGSKAHKVIARTLLEQAEAQQFVRMGYVREEGRAAYWGEIYKTVTLEPGTTLYVGTECGTRRHTGRGWMVYANDYRPAETVTCAKCLARASKGA